MALSYQSSLPTLFLQGPNKAWTRGRQNVICVAGTPNSLGQRPVSQLARAGTHCGEAVMHRSATRLRCANRLTVGSWSLGLLIQSPRHLSKLTNNQCELLVLPTMSEN